MQAKKGCPLAPRNSIGYNLNTMKTLKIDGNNFSSLAEFYDEVEAKLTKNLDWRIGRNLDAFNDVLRGGFGQFKYEEKINLVWINTKKSKTDLGKNETIKYFEVKLQRCHPSNIPKVKKELANAKKGKGQTLYQILIEIIKGHEHINFKEK